ncbi:uncharacterized protein Pyn_11830 [Prunus yedoensis var. nudiflora]|uniref:Uncharacterized protein n=1 Tax=Prunus yedoensis var. nudiflora TaxID=2094558 RepID=A0A314YAY6_PRUYE|nr:uncharacterized protein Pyn_11830 [Prunus yedoensis var. nudiflora]
MDSSVQAEEKPSTLKRHSELVKGTSEDVLLSSGFRKDLISGKASELKAEKADETDDRGHHNQAENQRTDPESPSPSKKESNDLSIPENRAVGGSSSAVTDHDDEHVEENLESKEGNDQLGEPVLSKVPSDLPMQEVEEHLRSRLCKLTSMEAEEADECTSTTADASSVSAAGWPSCFSHVPAAAKGPCIPPEDLLKSKGEVGWKGSAATSAFRPAEPRKALEMLLGSSISVLEPTAGKQGAPGFGH